MTYCATDRMLPKWKRFESKSVPRVLVGGKGFTGPPAGDNPDDRPGSGEYVAEIHDPQFDGNDAAVDVANEAPFPAWRAMPLADRSALLLKLAERRKTQTDFWPRIDALDAGKIEAQAGLANVPKLLSATMRYFRRLCPKSVSGPRKISTLGRDSEAWTYRQPGRLCASSSPELPVPAIGGWGDLAGTRLGGNTVREQTREDTSLSAIYLLGRARHVQVGCPMVWINVVTAAAPGGAALSRRTSQSQTHSFTGSSRGRTVSSVNPAAGQSCAGETRTRAQGAAVVFNDVMWPKRRRKLSAQFIVPLPGKSAANATVADPKRDLRTSCRQRVARTENAKNPHRSPARSGEVPEMGPVSTRKQ